jgi:hypothetical protein
MKLKKKYNHKKILKEKIEINRMRVKFEEEKKKRGSIILDCRAKLKRKINSKK